MYYFKILLHLKKKEVFYYWLLDSSCFMRPVSVRSYTVKKTRNDDY